MHNRPYENYAAYLRHQRSKMSPALIAKLKARREERLANFRTEMAPLADFVGSDADDWLGSRAICLGARLGEEVEVLREMGYNAVGVDLVPAPPLVIQGDFHDLRMQFADNTFDLVYCNSVDHVFSLGKFAAEVARILKRDGHFFARIGEGMFGKYESLRIDDAGEFVKAMRVEAFRLVKISDNGAEGTAVRLLILLTWEGSA